MFRNSINPTDAKLWAPNFRVTGSLFKVQILDFPGGPVVKNSPSSHSCLWWPYSFCGVCVCVCVCVHVCVRLVTQSCWLFGTPWTVAAQAPLSMGILQARILEWVAMSFSRDSSWPRKQIRVSCIAGRFLTSWATIEALCGVCSSLNKSTYYLKKKRIHLPMQGMKFWSLIRELRSHVPQGN